jgi:hypothetical protein
LRSAVIARAPDCLPCEYDRRQTPIVCPTIRGQELIESWHEFFGLSNDALTVDLTDGRTIIVPLLWYPRLWHGSARERKRLEVLGDGAYIHWPDLDEDLTVAGLLAGRRPVLKKQIC